MCMVFCHLCVVYGCSWIYTSTGRNPQNMQGQIAFAVLPHTVMLMQQRIQDWVEGGGGNPGQPNFADIAERSCMNKAYLTRIIFCMHEQRNEIHSGSLIIETFWLTYNSLYHCKNLYICDRRVAFYSFRRDTSGDAPQLGHMQHWRGVVTSCWVVTSCFHDVMLQYDVIRDVIWHVLRVSIKGPGTAPRGFAGSTSVG